MLSYEVCRCYKRYHSGGQEGEVAVSHEVNIDRRNMLRLGPLHIGSSK